MAENEEYQVSSIAVFNNIGQLRENEIKNLRKIISESEKVNQLMVTKVFTSTP